MRDINHQFPKQRRYWLWVKSGGRICNLRWFHVGWCDAYQMRGFMGECAIQVQPYRSLSCDPSSTEKWGATPGIGSPPNTRGWKSGYVACHKTRNGCGINAWIFSEEFSALFSACYSFSKARRTNQMKINAIELYHVSVPLKETFWPTWSWRGERKVLG